MEARSPAEILDLDGGVLCLDFVNTVDGHRAGKHYDYLVEYVDFVRWAVHAGALVEAEAEELLASAAASSAAARTVLDAAAAVREALYRIFLAVMEGAQPGGADVREVNAAIGRAFAHLVLQEENGEFAWTWADGTGLERPLWPVVRSAADLLVSPERVHVRMCGSETCGWLFLDTTKNHNRRWCDMAGCGSRAKARRYYARRRGQQ
jgi:predicted RNA-binding Zn ribbon-like protein